MKRTNGKNVAAPVAEGVPAPKVKRSELTRKRILDAAALWLDKKGLAQMSLQDLAQEVGMQTASFYYHFPSKDALIEEVLQIGIELVYRDVQKAVEALGPERSHRDRVQTAIKAHLSSLLTHGDYTSANIRNFPLASPPLRAKNLSIRREYGGYWRTILEDAQRAGEIAPNVDLSLLRLVLIGALNWSIEWFNPRKKSIDAIAEDIGSMLFDGIGQQRAVEAPVGRRSSTRAKAA